MMHSSNKSAGKWVFILATLFIMACLAGCNNGSPQELQAQQGSLIMAETDTSLSCRQPDGTVSVIPKNPKRTVILLTSLLNLWDEAGGQAVGRCYGKLNVPEKFLKVPQVGSFNNPNIEKVIAMEPDLVISSDLPNFRAIIPILKQNKIAYTSLSYVNHNDYLHILELFSKINGSEERYELAKKTMNDRVKAVLSKYQEGKSPKVLIVFATSNSVSCELSNSQTGVMLTMLGAKNIIPPRFHVESKTRVDFSLEHIVQLDPDIILLNTMGDVDTCRRRLKTEFENNAAWASLRAIRNGRFHVLPKEYFLYKPNERFPEALEYLGKMLYPDGAVDVKSL